MKARFLWITVLAALGVLFAIARRPLSLGDVVFVRQRLQAHRIKSHADPVALQCWATNMLAAHSKDEAVYYDLHSTNVPADILALYPGRPAVVAGRDSLVIHWGRTHPSIHVGATNFTLTKPLAMRWSPGVYLVLAE